MSDDTLQPDVTTPQNPSSGEVLNECQSIRNPRSNAQSPPSPNEHQEPLPAVEQEFPLKGPYLFQPKTNGDHWEQSFNAVEKHDNDMCKSWREEIDTLLVFAGLFTAIVTAFTVESYRWLRQDPADLSNELLMIVVIQQQQQQASPSSFPSLTPKEFTPTNSAIRINCLWFLSITISLTAGVIGILCKQWMREFQRDAALPAKDALALRQLRLLGWERWGVPQFISLPAILLQASLLVFFAGLLDLLWNEIHCYPVAICATGVIACTTISMGMTTILPTLYFLCQDGAQIEDGPSYQCPYKSPQSYLCLKLVTALSRGYLCSYSKPHPFKSGWLGMERKMLNRRVYACGTSYTTSARTRYTSLLLTWMKDTLAYNKDVRNNLLHCMQDSRLFCANHVNRSHIVLWETQKQCARDLFPDEVFCRLGDENENAVFHLEVALRMHMSQICLPDPVFRRINELRHNVTVPETLAKQVFLYAKHCIIARDQKTAGSFHYMWTAILNLCVTAPTFDNDFIELLYHYARRTCSSRSRTEHPDPFLTAVAHVVRTRKKFFHSISNRCIFLPLMTMVRTAHCHLKYPNTRADWEFVTSTVKAQTSLDPSFFDGHSFQDEPSDSRTPCIPIPSESSSPLIDQSQDQIKVLLQVPETTA